jgi:hypothetical protein
MEIHAKCSHFPQNTSFFKKKWIILFFYLRGVNKIGNFAKSKSNNWQNNSKNKQKQITPYNNLT